MPDEPQTKQSLPEEISTSLASVWAQYVGERPSDPEIEVDGSVVRWTLKDSVSEFDAGIAASAAAAAEEGEGQRPAHTENGYKHAAAAAVTRLTRRRVTAVISKHDAKTGTVTETFILDAPASRNRH